MIVHDLHIAEHLAKSKLNEITSDFLDGDVIYNSLMIVAYNIIFLSISKINFIK